MGLFGVSFKYYHIRIRKDSQTYFNLTEFVNILCVYPGTVSMGCCVKCIFFIGWLQMFY